MKNCLPWETTATDGDGGKVAAAAGTQVVRRLIVVMLFTAATLDLAKAGDEADAAAGKAAFPGGGRRVGAGMGAGRDPEGRTEAFDELVKSGKMPQPKVLTKRRKAWDVRALDIAIDDLPTVGVDNATDDTWSDIDAA